MGPNQDKNEAKMGPKWNKRETKMGSKRDINRTKWDQKGPKIDQLGSKSPKKVPIGTKMGPNVYQCFDTFREPYLC